MPLEANTIIKLCPAVRQTRVADEGILLHQEKAEILVLNEVAIRFVELLAEERTFSIIIKQLIEEYDVDHETIERDLADLVEELSNKQIVTIT